MPKQRASLKGLGARLEAEAPPDRDEHLVDALAGEGRQIVNVPLTAITPNPNQPRKHFDSEALEDLANSIRTRGLLQPIIVKRPDEGGDGYLLVAGERRFRAAGMAGLKKIPALVTTGDELEIAIVENLQREDLRPVEEADALQSLADRYNYTQEQLATVVGKSRVSVAETLSLLTLPDGIKEECRSTDTASKTLLLQVVRERDPEKRAALWEAIKGGKLTARAAREARQPKETRGRPKHASKTIQMTTPVEATVTVRFKKASATAKEVWDALAAATAEQAKALDAEGRNSPEQP